MTDDARAGSGADTEGADRPRVVALVVLRSPAGAPRDTDLTAATIARHRPEPGAAAEVSARLADAGFMVGPAIGISFSVEGSPEQFRRFFGAAPVHAADGGWTSERGGDELPLDALAEPLRARIAAVVFERPVEIHGPET